MIREILAADPENPTTSIPAAADFLLHTVKRKAVVFLISDFFAHDLKKPLSALANKHDAIALQVTDPMERKLPRVGKITLADPETGIQTTVNTNNASVRTGFARLSQQHYEGLAKLFKQHGIDHLELSTTEDYLPHLHRLFKERIRRRNF